MTTEGVFKLGKTIGAPQHTGECVSALRDMLTVKREGDAKRDIYSGAVRSLNAAQKALTEIRNQFFYTRTKFLGVLSEFKARKAELNSTKDALREKERLLKEVQAGCPRCNFLRNAGGSKA